MKWPEGFKTKAERKRRLYLIAAAQLREHFDVGGSFGAWADYEQLSYENLVKFEAEAAELVKWLEAKSQKRGP